MTVPAPATPEEPADADGAPRVSTTFLVQARSVLEELRQRLGLNLGLLRRDGDRAFLLEAVTERDLAVPLGASFPWRRSLACAVLDEGWPALVADTREAQAWQATPDVASWAVLPLRDRSGSLLGVLVATGQRPAPGLTQAVERAQVFVDLLAGLLEHELDAQQASRRARRAEADAHTDALTGLPNRRAWDDALTAADQQRAGDRPAGVLVVDLDGLKLLNDTAGHRAGDELLRRTGSVLASSVRDSDCVARLGGDEFGVLLDGADATEVEQARDRLVGALAAAGVSASVGMAVADGPVDLMTTWHAADAQMYRDKRSRSARPAVAARRGLVRDETSERDRSLRWLLRRLRVELDVEVAFVSEFVGDTQIVRDVSTAIGSDVEVGLILPLAESLCRRVVSGDLPPIVPDVRDFPGAAALGNVLRLHIGSYLAVPLRLTDGQLYGTLCIYNRQPQPHRGEADLAYLRGAAVGVLEVVERRRRADARRHAQVAAVDDLLAGGGPPLHASPVLALPERGPVGRWVRPGRDVTGQRRWPGSDDPTIGERVELGVLATLLSGLLPAGWCAIELSPYVLRSVRLRAVLAGAPLARLVLGVRAGDGPVGDLEALATALAPLRGEGLRLALCGVERAADVLQALPVLAPEFLCLDLDDRGPGGTAALAEPRRLIAPLVALAASVLAKVVVAGASEQDHRLLAGAGVPLVLGAEGLLAVPAAGPVSPDAAGAGPAPAGHS